MYWLYVLHSTTVKRFYIGTTSNLDRRIHYHNAGRSPYTRKKGPWRLVYSEQFESRREALAREREIKDWKSSKRIVETLNISVDNMGSSGPVRTG